MSNHLLKTRKLKKDYSFTYKPGTPLAQTYTVPAGTSVTNQTACGIDSTGTYWFVNQFGWIPKIKMGDQEITNVMAVHDFSHYGINIPEEYLD
jgi:hypothetical protein